MAELSEMKILAHMVESARELTRFYLKHAEEADKHKTHTINGYTTNSILWTVAHLAWSQEYLILKSVANKDLGIPWFELFVIGKEQPATELLPPWEEVLTAFNDVHKGTMELLRSLPDSVLDELNHGDLEISTRRKKRELIVHFCRHECAHAGQIGLMIRMQGKKISWG